MKNYRILKEAPIPKSPLGFNHFSLATKHNFSENCETIIRDWKKNATIEKGYFSRILSTMRSEGSVLICDGLVLTGGEDEDASAYTLSIAGLNAPVCTCYIVFNEKYADKYWELLLNTYAKSNAAHIHKDCLTCRPAAPYACDVIFTSSMSVWLLSQIMSGNYKETPDWIGSFFSNLTAHLLFERSRNQ